MQVFNTLTRAKSDFAPFDGETVRMYVCGITPYSPAHVGHAMSYIIFDVVRRYLEWRGLAVKHVQNFTDIDDKIIERAARLGIDSAELAGRHIDDFHAEMAELNILPAHVYPRATEELPKIIELIEGLIASGYAYAAGGDVYFRVRQDDDYGALSHRTLEGMLAGARVEPGAGKEDPLDFALWKGAKEGEPAWPSPWGPGRPGWHIECSAMSLRHLGETIDIHGGGADLIFPHHENEIAQSESFTGKTPFVRFWMHNGLLQLGEEKMSKSLGNLITVREALDRHNPDAIRVFVLSSYYRSPLKFSEENVSAAGRGAQRLRHAAAATSKAGGSGALDAAEHRERFITAMDDDFNTPQAVASLFDLARDINRAAEEGRDVAGAQAALLELTGVLGLTLETPKLDAETGPALDLLIETRAAFRGAKRFDLADMVRDRLTALGVSLEDGPDGTRWTAEEKIGDADLLLDVLVEARNAAREAKEFGVADIIRDRLDGLGVLLEDGPDGTRRRPKS